MSGAVISPREPPIIPAPPGRGLWLLAVIVAVSLLAALVAIGGAAALRQAQGLALRLAGSATVAAAPAGLESAEAAQARAAESLRRVPGVAEARSLDPSSEDPTLGRLIGGRRPGVAWADSRLVAVTFRPGARVDALDLTRALRDEDVAAAVDDHGLASGPVERTGAFAALGAAGAILLVTAAMAGTIAGAARGRCRRATDRLRLMRRLGARNGFLAGAIAAPLTLGVALAAGAGAGAGVLIAATPSFAHGLAPGLAPGGADLLAAIAWPPVAALVGAAAAHWATMRVLKSDP